MRNGKALPITTMSVAVVVALGLILGACGGDEPAPSAEAVRPDPPPPVETPVTPPPPRPADPPPAPKQDTAQASFLDDTYWAPGSEGNLVMGLDGGQYSPYLMSVVEEVQRFLFEQDLYDGPVTGVLDLDTMNALGEFQEQNGLAKSGVPSPNTREAMQQSASS